MAVKLFAAIVIGSVETEMRIYELNPRKGMKELDCIRTRLALGEDAYSDRELDPARVKELCLVLKEFKGIMEGYQVDGYRACATSAFRELRSSLIMRDQVEIQTGLRIHVISNSEQRFLDYKSIASEGIYFEKIIANGTAIVDIGGNSMQISVFDKDKLITTQNIRVGKVSTREHYSSAARNERHYQAMVREIMEHELNGFAKLYQKERPIQNLIICDSDLLEIAQKRIDLFQPEKGQMPESDIFHISADQYRSLYAKMLTMRAEEISDQFGITYDAAEMTVQSMVYISCLLERMGADVLWLMDVSICDGMCYAYGVSNKLLKASHDFDEDIIAAARNIAKRYKSSQAHIRYTEEVCIEIFNKMKKLHGLKNRDRLLLQIAAILHNCGKYISLANVSECAYNIIMATEIIGLSHDERKIIANVVYYNTAEFDYYDEADPSDLSREEYLLIAKLTAILRIANALDRSHLQKCKGAVITLKEDQLAINVQTQQDLSLEKITLAERAAFFEEVFNVHPQIHQKKR